MNPISTRAMRVSMTRAAVLKRHARTAARKPVSMKAPAALKRVTAVHKSTVQILPKRHLTIGKSGVGMRRAGSGSTAKPSFKQIRPASLRSPIKPRAAKKKLVFIKPAPKPKGRHMDMTGQGLKKIQGYEGGFGPIYDPFAGAEGSVSPFGIFAGNNAQMSVPVDRDLDDPPKSARLFITGIPAWLDGSKVYYDLLVFLSQHNVILSTLNFTSHAEEGQAAWAKVTLSYEAEKMLKSHDNVIQHSIYDIFSIPESIRLNPRHLLINLVEDVK